MTDVYTIDEVARHNNAKDLWVVIHDVIYNVTTFHKEHPGGEEVLLQLAGQDATNHFDSIGHSPEAINLREKFRIGNLIVNDGSDKLTGTEIKEPVEDGWQYEEEPETEKQSWRLKFICVVVVIYAIMIFYWFRT